MNKNLFLKISLFAGAIFGSSHSFAIAMDFTGTYRFEWMELDRPSLTTPYERKAYGLNYLGLNGKIIASDGINIHTRLDVLPNQDSAYQNTQFGQQWGSGNSNSSAVNSNVTSKAPDSQSLKVSQLYLNINQEYGSLIIGRAPFHFGLGINYNAGLGPFDHYATVMDMVSFKFLIDNVKYMPMIARVYDPYISQGGILQSESFLIEYESPDNGNLIGVMLERKKGSNEANDIPVNTGAAGYNNPNGISADSGLSSDRTDVSLQRTSFVLGKEWEPFGFKIEAGFINGDLGLKKNGQGIRWNAYGIASELFFPRPQSKWDWRLHFGFATGDNPDTADYESFHFDRNYNVAFLLFNHRVGSYDVLRTGLIRDQYNPADGSTRKGLATSLDDEAVSNTFYISPRAKYIWNDKLDLVNTVTFANLVANPLSGGVQANKSLGFEWDIEFVYKPREKVQWVNQIGLLFPGSAFKVDSIPGSNNSFTYGFSTKAAISF